MFNILMPPGQEDIMEDHYEENVSTYKSRRIVSTCLPNLLNDLMDIQFTPSTELAKIYFANQGMNPLYSLTNDREVIEMVNQYTPQLEKAFCGAVADKLVLACRALEKILTHGLKGLICTKQLQQVVSMEYLKRDKAEFFRDSRNLYMEFKIEANRIANEETRNYRWWYNSDNDPYCDNVVQYPVDIRDIKKALILLGKTLRSENLAYDLDSLKAVAMHLSMIYDSIEFYDQPKTITQHEYKDICSYIMKQNITMPWPVWERPEDLDMAQVVMTRDLSRAVRKVAKFDKPTLNVYTRNLLEWFAVESFIMTNVVKESHGNQKKDYYSDSPIEASNY